MSIKTVLITGANGFLGRAVCKRALEEDLAVRGVLRKKIDKEDTNLAAQVERIIIGDINDSTDWSSALTDCDVVIHLAARVHVMKETADSPLAEFRLVNVLGTEHLARSAAAAGVKRLVYVSSIGVNGASTPAQPFSENDVVQPHSPYALSKWEAEQALQKISAETGLEVVIVRPPLVYGANAKGNFATLLSVVRRGLPLPFKNVRNLRSFIYVDNLADALIVCATHKNAAGKTFLVSDGEDISLSDLLLKLSMLLDRKPRLFGLPKWALRFLFCSVGKSELMNKLIDSLQIDSSKIREQLNWQPPYSLDEGLRATVRGVHK